MKDSIVKHAVWPVAGALQTGRLNQACIGEHLIELVLGKADISRIKIAQRGPVEMGAGKVDDIVPPHAFQIGQA